MKMKSAQISKPGGEWELAKRGVPEPGRRQARVKVEPCGVCHSETLAKKSGAHHDIGRVRFRVVLGM